MAITLDRQVITKHCDTCAADFRVVRGSAFDCGRPMGLYLIALHGHSADGLLAHLATAILEEKTGEPVASAMVVSATSDQFQFSLVDWNESPWNEERYLGRMLSRADVLSSSSKQIFFNIADRVVEDLAEVREYFSG